MLPPIFDPWPKIFEHLEKKPPLQYIVVLYFCYVDDQIQMIHLVW